MLSFERKEFFAQQAKTLIKYELGDYKQYEQALSDGCVCYLECYLVPIYTKRFEASVISLNHDTCKRLIVIDLMRD